MSEDEIKHNLLEGLKQLDMNIKLLHDHHKTIGLNIKDPYTVNTDNLMLAEYGRRSLAMLAAPQTTDKSVNIEQREKLARIDEVERFSRFGSKLADGNDLVSVLAAEHKYTQVRLATLKGDN